jgi:hypothetical protein
LWFLIIETLVEGIIIHLRFNLPMDEALNLFLKEQTVSRSAVQNNYSPLPRSPFVGSPEHYSTSACLVWMSKDIYFLYRSDDRTEESESQQFARKLHSSTLYLKLKSIELEPSSLPSPVVLFSSPSSEGIRRTASGKTPRNLFELTFPSEGDDLEFDFDEKSHNRFILFANSLRYLENPNQFHQQLQDLFTEDHARISADTEQNKSVVVPSSAELDIQLSHALASVLYAHWVHVQRSKIPNSMPGGFSSSMSPTGGKRLLKSINSIIVPSPLSLPAKHLMVQALTDASIEVKMIHRYYHRTTVACGLPS